jgi:hypothetical protein
MIDRFRKPDRSGHFSGTVLPDSPREATSGPRHSVSPPTIDSPEADRPRDSTDRLGPTGDDEANGLARTLRDLVQSLPRHPVDSVQGAIESAPDSIIGPVTPTFEDQFSVERWVESEDGVRKIELNSSVSGRIGSSAPSDHENAPARSDSGRSDRREEIAALSSITTPYERVYGDPAGTPIGNRLEPGKLPIAGSGLSADRVRSVESPGIRAAELAHSPVADISSNNLAAATGVGNTELSLDLGRWTSSPDRESPDSMMRGGALSIGTPPETVAVGPVGPAGRHDEDFDRASGESGTATRWSGLSGGDPLSSRPTAISPADEGPTGVDLSPTNALLGQILDELRRHHQSAPIASSRFVYPER